MKKLFASKTFVLSIIILLLVAVAAFSLYSYIMLKKQYDSSPAAAQKAAAAQATQLVGEVGKLMLLPANETPTVATVSDITKLKDQSFFVNAKNGDNVLIYANEKLAILYDPKKHIIINVGTVNLNSNNQTAPTNQPQARILLRNGTTVTGLTNKVETELQQAFPQSNIVGRIQDQNTSYTETLIIPITDTAKTAADNIAQALHATVGTLPATEVSPTNADILIIVGKNQQ